MDRSIAVRTPESIAFSYELAGLGSRFLAIAIDLAIQIGLTVALFWTAIGLSANAVAFEVPRWSRSAGIAAVAFVLFAIYFGYFILFEAFWNGQTPGKRLLGIRVVRDRGMPLDLTSSFVRNVVRTVEFSLGFYAIAA
ncbi:MAG: RDD family protein, partial [Candidatus Eremiobacteraeota bacterium]|nr:RDD family protein [Candidatus Eremiobacteraeota bacterium]